MPPGAYAIVGMFAVVSVATGAFASTVVGPRRRWSAIVPTLAAFGSLYAVGHRLVISVGPEVSLFGFRISLLFDVAVALAASFAAATAQRALLRLLEPQQRRTGRNGLA